MRLRPAVRGGGRRRALTAAGLLLALGTGCSSQEAQPAEPTRTPSSPTPSASAASTGADLLIASATVLDAGHGPELCVGAVATSLPPQCGGPHLVGWTWPKEGTTRASGVTWGEFYVVGTYDGRRFRVDRTVSKEQATASLPPPDEPDFATPCPEPAGGWRAPEPARSTEQDRDEVVRLAEQLPGYGSLWVDDRGDPAQNPLTTVVDVTVTGDVGEAERRLRTVWGGPLCVSTVAHSRRELDGIGRRLEHEPGLLTSSVDRGYVEIELTYDDGSVQRRCDRRFGPGLVRVTSALRPYVG